MYRAFAGLFASLGLAISVCAAPVLAQEAPGEAPAAAPPAAPIPYTVLRPQAARRAPARPRGAAPPAVRPAGVTTPAAPLPVDPALEGFIDGMARDALAADHIAGLTVAVVRGGQVALVKGYGYADVAAGRKVDGDKTLFRLGSLSQTLTWMAVLKEVEAGRMRLDAPVNLYLPERLQVRDQGFDNPVRVRDLMDHTAGFEVRILGRMFESDPAQMRSMATWLRQERPDRVREPGLTTAYSSYGVALGGAAVEQVVGQPFDRLIAQQVLAPAGMWRTTFRQPNPSRPDLTSPMDAGLAASLSKGYRWRDGGLEALPFEFIEGVPANAASSTAGDMARFMRLILGGGSLDGAAVYGPRTAQALAAPLWRPRADVPGWRHGLMDIQLPGGRIAAGAAGDTMLFRNRMVLVPELGLGVFVAANTDTGAAFAARLPEAVVQRFYGAPDAPPKGDPSLYERRRVYEGRYLSTWRPYGGLEGFVIGLFYAGARVTVTRDGFLVTEDATGQRRWAPVSDTRFQSVDGAETLDVVVENGRAVRILGATETRERSPLWFNPGFLAVMSLLVAVASVAALAAPLLRDRREFRQAQAQARAGMAQISQSVLWLVALVCFGTRALTGARDAAVAMDQWPSIWLLVASACALVAAALSVFVLILLPWAWKGGRRVDSWTAGRKLRFTITALLFAAFSLILALGGALAPWDA